MLFVSHNMGAIKNLCRVSLWIENGKLKESGYTNKIIQKYLSLGHKGKGEIKFSSDDTMPAQIKSVHLLNNSKTIIFVIEKKTFLMYN